MGRVYHHEIGKRHTLKMSSATILKGKEISAVGTNEAYREGDVLQVAPGEPLPPGFEDEVQKIPQIQVSYQLR